VSIVLLEKQKEFYYLVLEVVYTTSLSYVSESHTYMGYPHVGVMLHKIFLLGLYNLMVVTGLILFGRVYFYWFIRFKK
jgi:hypothetical protein